MVTTMTASKNCISRARRIKFFFQLFQNYKNFKSLKDDEENLTLKNQAPDFFQISRCSAQILHNQTVKVSPPSPPALTEFPMSADVKIDVIDEDNAEEEVKDVFRLR